MSKDHTCLFEVTEILAAIDGAFFEAVEKVEAIDQSIKKELKTISKQIEEQNRLLKEYIGLM